MANQKKTAAVPASANQKQLPNDRELLALLLRTCERVIDYVNEIACREDRRHRAYVTAARQNGSDPLIDAWMQGVGNGARDQMAKPLPAIDAIVPYIGSQYAKLIAELQHMALPQFDFANPQSISSLGALLKHERLVTIFRALLACLHQLQGEVAKKLETICDAFCEIPARSYKAASEDPDLRDLITKDRAPGNVNRTQLDIAREVVNGDESLAKNLLRRAHDKKLLSPRRRKSDKARA